jgi:hypothetical protein
VVKKIVAQLAGGASRRKQETLVLPRFPETIVTFGRNSV